jgi:hypothetical protein
MADSWRMSAHRYRDGLLHNVGSRRFVEHHGLKEPIVEVDAVEVPDGDPSATHWAWLPTGKTEPIMIYPREGLFTMCFPYGSKTEVEHGKGRVVRLAVTEVPG